MIFRLVSLSVRAGLLGGFIYWTKDGGLWGTAEETQGFYNKSKEDFAKWTSTLPPIPIELPLPDVSVPAPEDLCTFVRVNWNKAIISAFDGLAVAPEKIMEWSEKGYNSLKQLMDNPTPEGKTSAN